MLTLAEKLKGISSLLGAGLKKYEKQDCLWENASEDCSKRRSSWNHGNFCHVLFCLFDLM